jgi:signal transduction histidine kinase
VALVVEALILAGLGAFLYVRFQDELVANLDTGLAAQASQLTDDGDVADFSDPSDLVIPGARGTAGVAQLIDRSGAVLQSTGEADGERPLITPGEQRQAETGVLRRSREVDGLGQTRLLAAPVGDGRVVVVGSSLAGVERATDDLLLLLVAGGLGALALSGAAAWWLASRALRPIDRLSAAAAAIGADDLDQRVPVPATGDEVARLAEVFNALLARVEQASVEQRGFLADASHELRSPLAVLQAELDVALRAPGSSPVPREILESLREEAGRLTQLTDNLLTLARADTGRLELARERVGLEDVARRALRLLGAGAQRKSVIVATALEPAPAWGDGDRLTQVAINLLDNAVRHAPPGSRLQVETGLVDGIAWLAVEDGGPGIPAELVPVLFERFTRADAARTRAEEGGGTGLGLAIAQAIASAHDGRVELEWTGPGGSRFALKLPARGPSSG